MIPYRLDLEPAELKLTHTALRSLLGDLRRDDHELRDIVRGVLAKLPPAEVVAEIHLDTARRRAML
jgi:hypothetical protein